MSTPEPVLFVSHEGTRTGAPIALLHLVRWLRDHTAIEPHIGILRDGPLSAAFAEVGPTTVLGDDVGWPTPTEAERSLAEQGRHDAVVRKQVARLRDQVAVLAEARTVYVNSAASLRILHHLPGADTVLAHVHELRSALTWSVGPLDPPLLRTRVDHVIAAADCVADNLVRQLEVDRADITRVYEFIDPTQVLAPPTRSRAEVRAGLGLPADAAVIGGSGWADWRKGIDLFIQIAHRLRRAGRDDVHLVWVGGLPGGDEGDQIAFDVARSGVADQVHLVGLQPDPHDWYRAFDVFALTSREDPYPLVGLETALLGVPMICFADSGGMNELVRRSEDEGAGPSGVIVPYVDVEAMAEAALGLIDDPDLRGAMGATAARIVDRDHRVDVAGPQILEVIERAMAKGGRTR